MLSKAVALVPNNTVVFSCKSCSLSQYCSDLDRCMRTSSSWGLVTQSMDIAPTPAKYTRKLNRIHKLFRGKSIGVPQSHLPWPSGFALERVGRRWTSAVLHGTGSGRQRGEVVRNECHSAHMLLTTSGRVAAGHKMPTCAACLLLRLQVCYVRSNRMLSSTDQEADSLHLRSSWFRGSPRLPIRIL